MRSIFHWGLSVPEKKVSVQFRKLSLCDGLKRILAQVDYSFIFDRDSRIFGVYIVEKGSSQTAQTFTTETGTAISTDGKHAAVGSFLNSGMSPLDGPVEISEEELKSLKVTRNCPPPGVPVMVSPEELESLKVIENCSHGYLLI